MLRRAAAIPLLLASLASPAAAVVLDFEGWPATPIDYDGPSTITPLPESVITDQFRDQGILFGWPGVSAGVAVFSHPDLLASSPVNSVAAMDAAGLVPSSPGGSGVLVGDVHVSFVEPGTTVPEEVDFVRFTLGDIGGDLDEFVIRAWDLSGALVLERPESGSERFAVTIAQPGMHHLEIDFLGDAGYSLDDFETKTVIVPATCPLRTAWLAERDRPAAERVALWSDATSCPGENLPADVLVDDFPPLGSADVDPLLDGRELVVYSVTCPCEGLLLMLRDDAVRATWR